MQDRLWAILDAMMTLLRVCCDALCGTPSQTGAAARIPSLGSFWLSIELDSSRMDVVSRSVFWGGAGPPEALQSAPVAVASPPLTTAAAVRAVGDAPESLWWLGA